jgi:hypothetical protein
MWRYFTKELSDAALKLPVWFRNGSSDKFAKKEEKNDT